jgi:hypothetical protein
MFSGPAIAARPWDPSEPNAIDCLQVVYKIAERCNLNCSYCYYYNMGDETSLSRPARATLGVTADLARWLAQGVRELGIRKVHISFHGGEPMLVRAAEFARALTAEVGPLATASATLAGQPAINSIDDISIDGTHLALIFDAGLLTKGQPTTIVETTESGLKVGRIGAISQAQLAEVTPDISLIGN